MCDFSVFGIDNYFKTIVCADDTNEHKPNLNTSISYLTPLDAIQHLCI